MASPKPESVISSLPNEPAEFAANAIDTAPPRAEGSTLTHLQDGPESPWHDYCRLLLQRLDHWKSQSAKSYVLGITSCRPGAGVTSLVSHLGSTTAADTQMSVLLIDANLDDPLLDRLFARRAVPGLADVLLGGIPPAEAIQATNIARLDLLTAGSFVGSSVRAFSSPNLPSTLESLRDKYDLILVDLPALEGSAAAACTAGWLDGIVLVVEAERDATEAAQYAQQVLVQARAQLLGVVLNKRPN